MHNRNYYGTIILYYYTVFSFHPRAKILDYDDVWTTGDTKESNPDSRYRSDEGLDIHCQFFRSSLQWKLRLSLEVDTVD